MKPFDNLGQQPGMDRGPGRPGMDRGPGRGMGGPFGQPPMQPRPLVPADYFTGPRGATTGGPRPAPLTAPINQTFPAIKPLMPASMTVDDFMSTRGATTGGARPAMPTAPISQSFPAVRPPQSLFDANNAVQASPEFLAMQQYVESMKSGLTPGQMPTQDQLQQLAQLRNAFESSDAYKNMLAQDQAFQSQFTPMVGQLDRMATQMPVGSMPLGQPGMMGQPLGSMPLGSMGQPGMIPPGMTSPYQSGMIGPYNTTTTADMTRAPTQSVPFSQTLSQLGFGQLGTPSPMGQPPAFGQMNQQARPQQVTPMNQQQSTMGQQANPATSGGIASLGGGAAGGAGSFRM